MILNKEKANEWLHKMVNDPMIDDDWWEIRGQHIRDDICYYLDKNGEVNLKKLAKIHDDVVFWLYNKYFGDK